MKNERGTAMITATMLLMILTIIGLASVNTMQTERDIASGMTAYRMGFYAAESGIAYAKLAVKEDDIIEKTFPVEFECPDNAQFTLRLIASWQDSTGDWRFKVQSDSVPDGRRGAVTIEAELKLATQTRGSEIDKGHGETY